MPNFNRVFLMGNLTRDVELRAIQGGQNVAKIGLAINRTWMSQDNEKREEVTFVDCEAWGKTAEILHKYLAKGRPVFIEGRLKLDSWEDKEGKKQSKLKVVVEGFQFVDSKPGAGGSGGGEGNYSSESNVGSAGSGGGGGSGSDGGGGGGGNPRTFGSRPSAPSRPSSAAEDIPADDIPF